MLTPVHVKAYLEQGLSCDDIRVQGDGRYFDAVIVSPAFEGKGLVQQHPLVYRALGDRMHEEIHALAMKTLTPEQWSKQI